MSVEPCCCVKQQARHFPGQETGKMPNRVVLTVFSLDYYEFKWSKFRISSAKPDFVGLSHVSATAHSTGRTSCLFCAVQTVYWGARLPLIAACLTE